MDSGDRNNINGPSETNLRRLSRFLRTREGLLLLLIISIVLILGIAGMGNAPTDGDEDNYLNITLRMQFNALDPSFYIQPMFYFNIVALFHHIFYLLGLMAGKFEDRLDFLMYFLEKDLVFYTIGHVISLIAIIGAVIMVYRIGKKIAHGQIGLMAAFIFALAPKTIEYSNKFAVDGLTLFLILLSVWRILALETHGRMKNYIFTGITMGLAISTKYPAALLLPIFLIFHIIEVLRRGSGWRERVRDFFGPRLWLTLLMLLLAFFAASPYMTIRLPNMLNAIFYQVHHSSYMPSHAEFSYVKMLFSPVFNGIFIGFSLAGALYGLIRGPYQVRVLLILPCAFLIFFSFFVEKHERWILPAYSLLAVYAALAIAWLARLISGKRKLQNALLVIITLLAPLSFSYQEILGASFTKFNRRRPAQYRSSRKWLAENIPSGARLLMARQTLSLPQERLLQILDDKNHLYHNMIERICSKKPELCYTVYLQDCRRAMENCSLSFLKKKRIGYVIVNSMHMNSPQHLWLRRKGVPMGRITIPLGHHAEVYKVPAVERNRIVIK